MEARRPDTADQIVVMSGVGRSFSGTAVLSGIDLTVSAGEVVGLVGPNGGGKSTLLALISGLLRPSQGSVKVCDIEAHQLALTAAGMVGLVTARPGLYPLLTGRENLHHFGGLFGFSPDEIDDRAAPLMSSLNLETGMNQQVRLWSTGMQQKLSLIRALLLSPKLLLLDEPTANLDPLASQMLYTEVRRRADEGIACVLVTHDLSAAESICDRVLIIERELKQELALSERRAPIVGPLLKAWRQEVGER